MMITFGLTTDGSPSPALIAVLVVAGVLVLWVALKVGKFILKLVFGLLGLALLVGAVWWFFLRH